MKKLFISYLILLSGVASAQNVGIGIPIPLEQLHTSGTVRFENYKGLGTRTVQMDASGKLVVTGAGAVFTNSTPLAIPDNGCAGGNGLTTKYTMDWKSIGLKAID